MTARYVTCADIGDHSGLAHRPQPAGVLTPVVVVAVAVLVAAVVDVANARHAVPALAAHHAVATMKTATETTTVIVIAVTVVIVIALAVQMTVIVIATETETVIGR